MLKYYVTTDQTADFPSALCEEGFDVLKMSYVLDGILYDDKERAFLSPEQFYTQIEAGKIASTAMPSQVDSQLFFENILKKGYDILHISFSSALSGSFNSYLKSAVSALEKFPDRKIRVIDSLCAACGEGLLVFYALKKRADGASLDENAEYVLNLRHHIGHAFTVDDMLNLYRGGRVSKTTAVVGQTFKMKPILTVSEKGELVPTNTVIGRRPALKALVDKMEAKGKEYKNDLIIIGHCGCFDDALILKSMVEERFGAQNIIICPISPIVGTHLGKGGITLHYLCKDKVPFIR